MSHQQLRHAQSRRLQRLIRTLCINALLISTVLYAHPAAAQRNTYGEVAVSRVVSVADGDTFYVDINHWPGVIGRNIAVRVSDIDAPELNSRCKSERIRAQHAKEQVSLLLANAKRIHLTQIKRDKYFRLNAQVWIDDVHLGRYLVARGLATHYAERSKKSACSRR